MNDRVYIIDTSAVLHNWTILQEKKNCVIPQIVLNDIEDFQNDSGELGDNARSAKYYISNLLNNESKELEFWQDNEERGHDAKILRTAQEVSTDKFHFNSTVTILTKSLSLRVKARNLGIDSEDYDDVGLASSIDGWEELPITVDELEYITSCKEKTFELPNYAALGVNEYVVCTVEGTRCPGMIYRHIGGGRFEFLDLKPHLCGIVPKNSEQIMLANSLLNQNIPLVSAIGNAGSGKTLLAIAAAIQQVMVKPKAYGKIIITRPIMPVGRDIGYLPGDVNEKMLEWIKPFMSNIEFIRDENKKLGRNKFANERVGDLMDLNNCKDVMEVLPLTYIRGCSISNAFIIVDEAQNATPSEIKTIVTRVGEGSKMVLMGDVNQIDNRFLSKECNGLTYVMKKFYNYDLYSHVTLKTVQRSKLAELATKIMF